MTAILIRVDRRRISDDIERVRLVSGAARRSIRAAWPSPVLGRCGDGFEILPTFGPSAGGPELEYSISVAGLFRLFTMFPHFRVCNRIRTFPLNHGFDIHPMDEA